MMYSRRRRLHRSIRHKLISASPWGAAAACAFPAAGARAPGREGRGANYTYTLGNSARPVERCLRWLGAEGAHLFGSHGADDP